LGELFVVAPERVGLLPRLQYSYDRTHQLAEDVPVDGGFDESSAPDQVSLNQVAAVEWQGEGWSAGYRSNESFQDNRQPGREQADLENRAHALVVGLTPHPRLQLSFDASRERSRNFETEARYQIWRGTVTATLQVMRSSTLTLLLGATSEGDLAGSSESRNLDYDLQWSTLFKRWQDHYAKVDGQIFVRYTSRYARSVDHVFVLESLTRQQALNAGFRVTFF
jgi:hypothetical protein